MVLALCLGIALPAWGQRVQFPTMVGGTSAPTTFDPYASPLAQSPALIRPRRPMRPPAAIRRPRSTARATTAPPVYTPPAAPPPAYSPYTAPSPYAAPATPYSPYAPSPYAPTPQPLYPEGIATPQIFPQGGFDYRQPIRLLQEVRGRYTWLSPMGSQSLGVNDVDVSATFALPFRSLSPFLITPGFTAHFFQGPVTEAPDFADLPPVTYDAFLDTAWHPQITPWLGANLGVRVGAYTDFNTFSTQSIRIMGRGLGVLTLTPTLQFALGVVYIDRVLVKILPAGGLIWTPNPDARYEILFPNPKLAHRWTTIGNTDVWFYATGEYGGGSWTMQRSMGGMVPTFNDQADYNDIRVALGLEAYGYRGMHGFFEVGYVFDRQIIYRGGAPEYNPSDTIMLRAGLSY